MATLSRKQLPAKHRQCDKAEQEKLPSSSPPPVRKRKSSFLESGEEVETTPPQDSKRNGSPSTPPKDSPQKGIDGAVGKIGTMAANAGKGSAAHHLQVCGPLNMQTLRGQLLGREVAMIICGEAHETAIDLTRKNSIVQRECEWIEVSQQDRSGFKYSSAVAVKRGVSLKVAKSWAKRMCANYSWGDTVAESEESSSDMEDGDYYYYEDSDPEAEAEWAAKAAAMRGGGHFLMFVPQSKAKGSKGTARIFARETPSSEHQLPRNAVLFEYQDTDQQARENRMRQFTNVPVSELDAVIDDRKLMRLEDGYELFDDWIIRHANSSFAHVEFLSEAPVKPEEVEFHDGSGKRSMPMAHKCLREIGADDDDEEDPDVADDGTGSYLDYLLRRVAANMLPERIHGVDPRILGVDPIYEHLAHKHQPMVDEEEPMLKELGHVREKMPPVLPSWESFFGSAAQLLYYDCGIKADYAPFLRACVRNADSLRNFFKGLYFGTVAEAYQNLDYNDATRPMTRIRSLTWDQNSADAPKIVRPDARELLPIQSAPIECYVKSSGSEPSRTWVSGLAEQIRQAGGTDVLAAAQAWYMGSVDHLLSNPKVGDDSGDYFAAWLRECYRDIYKDIDASDPLTMRKATKMYSYDKPKSKQLCHNLKDIKIPSVDAAFAELRSWDPEKRPSTNRERVMSQILVDAFSLRLVDLSAILKMASLAAAAPENKPVVLIFYAGEDHTRTVAEFWRSQGFSHGALPRKGYVGKRHYKFEEPRALTLPSYLHDFRELFSHSQKTPMQNTAKKVRKDNS